MGLLGVVLPGPDLTRPKVPLFVALTLIQALNVFPASQSLKRRIPGNTHQPSRKLRAALEAAYMLERTQEGILHGILRVGRIAQDCQ
jgi:hypothetical protein